MFHVLPFILLRSRGKITNESFWRCSFHPKERHVQFSHTPSFSVYALSFMPEVAECWQIVAELKWAFICKPSNESTSVVCREHETVLETDTAHSSWEFPWIHFIRILISESRGAWPDYATTRRANWNWRRWRVVEESWPNLESGFHGWTSPEIAEHARDLVHVTHFLRIWQLNKRNMRICFTKLLGIWQKPNPV